MKKEIWKYIKRSSKKYSISTLGNIRRNSGIVLNRGKHPFKINDRLIKKHYDRGGYLVTLISINGIRKNVKVHRLVAEAFIPNPNNKKEVNHKNGIKDDNRVSNLEWCSPKENTLHAVRMGLVNRCPNSNKSYKLSNSQVKDIRELVKRKSAKDLANIYEVNVKTIYRIKNKETRI